MALYFETETQGVSFLFLCGVGFVLALFFDGVSLLIRGRMKPLGDVLLLLLCGLLALVALVFLRANALRLFHWIAMLVGAILYLCGVRRLVLMFLEWLHERRKKKLE